MIEIRRVGDTRDTLGEVPIWCGRSQSLYWIDVRGKILRRRTLGGETAAWPMPDLVGSFALCDSGRVLLALRTSLAFFDPVHATLTPFVDLADGRADMQLNDGACDPQGRFWVGSMNDVARGPEGFLYRIDPEGSVRQMIPGIRVPNTLCWSADDRTMYFSGPEPRTIFAADFDIALGTMGAPRIFATLEAPDVPDGATVDAEGFLWCAIYDGWRIIRYAPDGRIDRVIPMQVQCPTSCAFGGPDLATLYVTTASQRLSPEALAEQPLAGALLALEPGVTGREEPRFADRP